MTYFNPTNHEKVMILHRWQQLRYGNYGTPFYVCSSLLTYIFTIYIRGLDNRCESPVDTLRWRRGGRQGAGRGRAGDKIAIMRYKTTDIAIGMSYNYVSINNKLN